jgi:predicted nucleic acid-binding protein
VPDRLLFDTDVIIDYLRREPQSIAYIEPLTEDILISAVTVAELHSGVREDERPNLELFLSVLDVVPVDLEIAVEAGSMRLQYRKSHRIGLPDALIAATARRVGAPLVTLNQKHFPMLEHLIIPYRKI